MAGYYATIGTDGRWYVYGNGQTLGPFSGPEAMAKATELNAQPVQQAPQPSSPATQPGTNGGTGLGPSRPHDLDPNAIYQTRNGPKKGSDIAAELRAAGYNGSGTEADMLNAYERAGQPTGSTSGSTNMPTGTAGTTGGFNNMAYTNIAYLEYLRGIANDLRDEAQKAWERAYRDKYYEEIEKGRLAQDAIKIANDYALGVAQLSLQESLGAMNIAAQLRGPRNAFQQQQVMTGLNQSGLTRGLGAIAGKYSLPTGTGDQARPQAANLQNFVEDIYLAGGYDPNRLAPSEQAMQQGNRYLSALDSQVFGPPSAQLTNEAALDWIWANAASRGHELAKFYASNGWDVSTPEGQRKVVLDWITKADPQWKGLTPQQVAAKLGYSAQQAQPRQQAQQGTPQLPQSVGTQSQPNGIGAQAVSIMPVGEPVPAPAPQPPAQPAQPTANIPGAYQAPAQSPVPWPTGAAAQRAFNREAVAPNKIVAREWLRLPQSTQDFMLSGYEGQGRDPSDVLWSISNSLPKWRLPRSYGMVA